MNRRSKNRLFLAAWLALFILLGFNVWSFQAGHLMIILFLGISVLGYAVYACSTRCPACGLRLMLRPVRMFGMQAFMWSLLIPANCGHCGEPVE